MVGAVARRLADEHGRPVRVLLSREDVVRLGPKRPPIAAGIRADGTGVRAGGAHAGPRGGRRARRRPASPSRRSTWPGRRRRWPCAAPAGSRRRSCCRRCGPTGPTRSGRPNGAVATAVVDDDRRARHACAAATPLDEVVLRSYCIGAAHMALGWVRSEGIAVDAAGEPHDLTIRSFGILRAVDMPPVDVRIERRRRAAGERLRRRVRRRGRRRLASPRLPAEWPAAGAARRASARLARRSHRRPPLQVGRHERARRPLHPHRASR